MPSDYNERLRNRCYKRKVIDLIAETVVDSIKLQQGQRLIVDYVDCPIKFELDPSTRKPFHKFMTDIPPMGECDVKFTRWSRMLGVETMIAHSVDGDFIPIALMEYEKQVNLLTSGDGRKNKSSSSSGPCSIAIFRMEYNMEPSPSSSSVADTSSCSKKRKVNAKDGSSKSVSLIAVGGKIQIRDSSNGENVVMASSSSSSSRVEKEEDDESKKKKRKKIRTMEYVNIPLLFHTLSECMRQCNPTAKFSPEHRSCYMRVICSLIALTGTDFTRKLPQISPKKVWDLIPTKTVWKALLDAFDPSSNQLRVGQGGLGEILVATLYSVKFSNHIPSGFGNSSMESMICAIKRSKLSEKTKMQIPSR